MSGEDDYITEWIWIWIWREKLNEKLDGWMGRMDGWMDGMDRWLNGMDAWIDGMDGWTEWINDMLNDYQIRKL